MKKYAYVLLLSTILVQPFFAQQTNNTQYKTQILQVFQNLEKNRVPHGILLDYGMEFTNLKAFNGTLTDSTYTTSQTISDIHKTLMMCRVREVNTGFVTPVDYTTRWFTQRQEGLIVMSGMYFKYNRFADNAYPSKLTYTNNKFSDKYVNGVWQNPYETRKTFALTAPIFHNKATRERNHYPSFTSNSYNF